MLMFFDTDTRQPPPKQVDELLDPDFARSVPTHSYELAQR